MATQDLSIDERIRTVILRIWPDRFGLDQLTEDAVLGSAGLGLDSVEIVELLFECEAACGARASEALFMTVPLTVGTVIDDLRASAA